MASVPGEHRRAPLFFSRTMNIKNHLLTIPLTRPPRRKPFWLILENTALVVTKENSAEHSPLALQCPSRSPDSQKKYQNTRRLLAFKGVCAEVSVHFMYGNYA